MPKGKKWRNLGRKGCSVFTADWLRAYPEIIWKYEQLLEKENTNRHIPRIILEIRTTSHMKLDKKPLLENLKKYGHEKSVTDNWDKIQHDLHCCGVENYKDWVELPV